MRVKNVVRWVVLFVALSPVAHAEDRGGYPPSAVQGGRAAPM